MEYNLPLINLTDHRLECFLHITNHTASHTPKDCCKSLRSVIRLIIINTIMINTSHGAPSPTSSFTINHKALKQKAIYQMSLCVGVD